MKRYLSFLAIALLACVSLARAEESCASVAATSGGTSVLAASANKGHTILIQNIGATNAVTCSVGGTPVSVQHGFFLAAAGGNLTMSVPPINPGTPGTSSVSLPSGAVKCITATSTSYVCASSW